MGITFVKCIVKKPEKPTKVAELEFLVDSGTAYSVVDSKILEKLGIKPHRAQDSP